MTPEEKLNNLLEEYGRGGKAKLAKFLDVSPVYVTRWVTDKKYNIPRDMIVKVEDFFNQPTGFLLTNTTAKVKYIPIVGTASCGGMDSNYLQDENSVTYYSGSNYNSSLYAVVANGDSMSPEIEDSDEVICDPTLDPISGDMVHYRIGDESAIKIYYKDSEAHIVQFIPYNHSEVFKTRTIRLDDEEANEVKISKVVSVNKLKFNNRMSRLKLIGKA